jgi:hypothetical protein
LNQNIQNAISILNLCGERSGTPLKQFIIDYISMILSRLPFEVVRSLDLFLDIKKKERKTELVWINGVFINNVENPWQPGYLNSILNDHNLLKTLLCFMETKRVVQLLFFGIALSSVVQDILIESKLSVIGCKNSHGSLGKIPKFIKTCKKLDFEHVKVHPLIFYEILTHID